jgi:hypothetical protein
LDNGRIGSCCIGVGRRGVYFYTGNCRENFEDCIVDRNAAEKGLAAMEGTLNSLVEEYGTPIVEIGEAPGIVTVEVLVPVCDLQLCATPTPFPSNAMLSCLIHPVLKS